MSVDTQQKMLDYIKRSGPLVAAAEKQASAQAQKAAAVKSIIPDVVDVLIKNDRIDASLREKAAQHLTDHVKTLELLASVAAHRTDAEATHLGSAAGSTKSASSKTSPYLGVYSSEDERPSGRQFMDAIIGNR